MNLILFILAIFFSQSFGLENMRCGTLSFAENLKNPQKRMLAKKQSCVPESSNGTIYQKKTTNFIIYYTNTGPHAVKSLDYIDSLAVYLEQAYTLHRNTIGMKSIAGTQQTYHYSQNVPNGLYPIEVIDIGLLRGYEGEFTQTFGLTFPDSKKPKETQIIIENDFLYYDGNCSQQPFKSSSTGVNYSVKWDLALKVTIFHELYHAFQAQYFNWLTYDTFWMEASATGAEEIGAPEVNDYISYLPTNFNNPGKSMENLGDMEEYGWAALYLFLYSQIDGRFDSAIWNYFSKYPKDNFAMQLARLADSLGYDAEDVFHEYAKRVFYSGSRANETSFWPDMPKWPNWKTNTKIPSVLQPGTIDFIKTATEPNTDSVARKSYIMDGSNIVWVLSRLLEKEYVGEAPSVVSNPQPSVYRSLGAIHFENLPKDAKAVEIRSVNGALLARIERKDGNSSSLSWTPEKIPAPGILYYRILPHGKNKAFIVKY